MHTRTVLTALALCMSLFSATSFAQYSTPVRDVENPARAPLRITGTGSVPVGFVGAFGITIGSVLPADRRYAIEYASVECAGSGGVEVARVWLSTAESLGGGSYRFHTYPIKLSKTTPDYAGTVSAIGSDTVRWYHDGGQAVQIGITLTGAAPAAISCRVEISGSTVSMP